MTRKHDDVMNDVLSGLDEQTGQGARTPSRFLRRSGTLAEQGAGERRETMLRLVDPARCRMWEHHNRNYALLTPDSCRDLIDGLKAQGEQEFPAIVRRLPEGESHDWEVICGARRHFAVSWLRANTYPQFRYLIEERELTDEEAFRLADIENRDRADISDYERAKDYAKAIDLYYGGQQKRMAERLEVSPSWLSRYLQLARLPGEIVAAFPAPNDLRELHARQLKPLLADEAAAERVLETARVIARERAAGQGSDVASVLSRLKQGARPPAAPKAKKVAVFRRGPGEQGITVKKSGKVVSMEFPAELSNDSLLAAFRAYLKSRKE
ncbi:MAG: ParB/RepB/Spo0J family partition protein [Pseudomonadota bacterium]